MSVIHDCMVSLDCMLYIEQSNQNWFGPGESDCLIKTKHYDGQFIGVDVM